MTKLMLINMFLQLFFIRITKHLEKDCDGNYTVLKSISIQYFIMPLSGWFNNYIYLTKEPRFLYIKHYDDNNKRK